MSITVYKAPNCLRCKITKEYLDARHIAYTAFDLGTDKDIVNKFYRDHRSSLYRNPEGVEFPMFHDEDNNVILQGTGVVLAYLLSGHALEPAVTRSDLLHGWISGLYVSQVPDGEEEHFLELTRLLAKGGLEVFLQSDGRKPELLERILKEDLAAKVALNILGPAALYPQLAGGPAPSAEELKKSVDLVRAHKNGSVRLWIKPVAGENGPEWLSPADAGAAAKMVADACGDMSLPFGIQVSPEQVKGLAPLENLLPYRSKARNFLPKAEIVKE